MYPLRSAVAITSALVAILFALCGRGSGGEIVFRNEIIPQKMVYVTCEPAGHHGPRNLGVPYLANITFTVTPDFRYCEGCIYDPVWMRCRTFTLYSHDRDYRRCVTQCTFVATAEGLYITEIVQRFVYGE